MKSRTTLFRKVIALVFSLRGFAEVTYFFVPQVFPLIGRSMSYVALLTCCLALSNSLLPIPAILHSLKGSILIGENYIWF